MTINLLKIPNENTKEIKEIRKVVFTDELNISESYLLDKYDETCDQFLIKNGEITIGALRLRKENNAVKLERMAILSEFRKMSFGIKAIYEVKKYSITKSESKIFLDSMYDIRDIYNKCGVAERGDIC